MKIRQMGWPFVLGALVALTALLVDQSGKAQDVNSGAEPAANGAHFFSRNSDRADRAFARVASNSPELACTFSAFFTVDPTQALHPIIHVDGRGILNCTNDQGLKTEFPVTVQVEGEVASVTPHVSDLWTGEFSFSVNSSVFVVPRETSQVADTYRARDTSMGDGPIVLLRGERHDLAIEMKASTKGRAPAVKVRQLHLSFDDEAPDLN